MAKSSRAIRVLLTVLALCAALLPLTVGAQKATHRLSKDDVVRLLEGGVSPRRVSQRAREQGIDFEVTPQVEGELRQAGATDELLATLRQIAPKPAQVVVETSSNAQVYLDDSFKGQASREGGLVIENGKPGDHLLRVSLTGKQDFEQNITVSARW